MDLKIPSKRKLAVFASVTIITVVVIISGLPSSKISNSSSLSTTSKALNCWNTSLGHAGRWKTTCSVKKIEKRPTSCNDWYPTQPLEQLDCEFTRKNVKEVSLITDPGNYVTGRFTDTGYTVKRWDFEFARNLKDIEFYSDGRILLAEGSRIHILNSKKRKGTYSLERFYERGPAPVEAIEIGPRENHLFIYYGVANQKNPPLKNPEVWTLKLGKYRIENDKLVRVSTLRNFSGHFWHNGGNGLELGPRGNLWMTLGDSDHPPNAQSKSVLRGSVLRMNLDGTVPESNPFNNSIYTYGHRNPQALGWNPDTGRAWSAEHGNWRHDEINRLDKGDNYGWGRYSCTDIAKRKVINHEFEYNPPERCFRNWTLAPSSLTFVDQKGHPWYGDMFVSGLRGNHLRKFEVRDSKIIEEEIFYVTRTPLKPNGISRRLRDVEFFNGSLWVLGDKSGLVKISPAGK